MKFEKKIALSWAAVILWMILIFAFSAQPAGESEQISHGITGIILKFIENLAVTTGVNADLIKEVNYIVRKSAHLFLFFVLSWLVVNAFLKTGVKEISAFIFAFIVTSLYAGTDEIHQIFVPGRACLWSDVGIDSFGAILGLCFAGAIFWVNTHGRFNLLLYINPAAYKLNMFKRLRTNNE